MSRTPRRRLPVGLAALTAAILLSACGSDAPRSQTPQIVIDDGSPLADLLLTVDDVAPISGFDGVERRELDELSLFENPDPRGPCGTPVTPPSFQPAAGRALSGATINLIQVIAPATPADRDYLEALIADQGPPCDGYTSTTNTGATQTVSDITVYAATGEGVLGVAWTNLVEVEGDFLYAGLVALEAADAITFVQVHGASPIPHEGMELLAERAIFRLHGQG